MQDYLETKRIAFPRFYFVAPADLLDIPSKVSVLATFQWRRWHCVNGPGHMQTPQDKIYPCVLLLTCAGPVQMSVTPWMWLTGCMHTSGSICCFVVMKFFAFPVTFSNSQVIEMSVICPWSFANLQVMFAGYVWWWVLVRWPCGAVA